MILMPSKTRRYALAESISRFKKAWPLLLTLSITSPLMAGCSFLSPYKAPTTQGNVMTKDALANLQEGLSKDQVRLLFGPPLGEHPFNPNNWQYIFYSSEQARHEKYAKQLTVLFDQDGFVSSWNVKDTNVTVKDEKPLLGLF